MGDFQGHPFRGNQWTASVSGGGSSAIVSHGDWREKIKPASEYEEEKMHDIFDSGRFISEMRVSHKSSFGTEYKVSVRQPMPEHVERIPPAYEGDTRDSFYDPAVVSIRKEYAETGKGLMFELKPEWSDRVGDLTSKREGVVFRGMSAEEMQSVLRTGKVQSAGAYNLGEQERGLTYYSTDPGQAESYAHGFAPFNKQATETRPSYVIEVRDPERPGTQPRGDERGIPGTIEGKDIIAIYEAKPYTYRSGEVEYVINRRGKGHEEGSRSVPAGSVAWRKVWSAS